jgi:hypothetical protein
VYARLNKLEERGNEIQHFDMRQKTVFVNLFQNLGSGYMKLLPEFQIESISAIEKKTRR